MAINGIVHGSNESRWGYAEESAFGTAIADDSVFYDFQGPIPDPDYGVFHDNEMKNLKSRVLEDSAQNFHSEAGGTRIIPFSDVVVQSTQGPHLIYAVMQNVSEGVGSPFEKTFTWVGMAGTQTTQPDFSANAGYLCTVGIYDPIASNHRKFTSCILRTLTLSCDLTGEDRRLKAAGEFISGFVNDVDANFSGTWNAGPSEYYNFSEPTIKTVGGADVVIYGFSITLNNNGVRVGSDSSGNAETYAVGVPMYETLLNITMKYDAVTDGLIADMIAGTSKSIQLATGTDGADGNLDFLLDECVIIGTPKDYGSPEGQKITIDCTVKADSATGAHTTITQSNGNDEGW